MNKQRSKVTVDNGSLLSDTAVTSVLQRSTQSATSKEPNQVPWADLLAPREASPAVVETDTRGKEAVRCPPSKGALGTALFHDVDEYEKTSDATDGMQDHWVMDKNERSESVSTNIVEVSKFNTV